MSQSLASGPGGKSNLKFLPQIIRILLIKHFSVYIQGIVTMDKICNTEACKWIEEHPHLSNIIILFVAVFFIGLLVLVFGLFLCYYAHKRCLLRNERRERRNNADTERNCQEVQRSRESNSQTTYGMPPKYGDLFPNGPPTYAVSHI